LPGGLKLREIWKSGDPNKDADVTRTKPPPEPANVLCRRLPVVSFPFTPIAPLLFPLEQHSQIFHDSISNLKM